MLFSDLRSDLVLLIVVIFLGFFVFFFWRRMVFYLVGEVFDFSWAGGVLFEVIVGVLEGICMLVDVFFKVFFLFFGFFWSVMPIRCSK